MENMGYHNMNFGYQNMSLRYLKINLEQRNMMSGYCNSVFTRAVLVVREISDIQNCEI